MTNSDLTVGSVDIEGMHVEWLEVGTGPLALCLHGFPDSAHTYRFLLPALAEAGYRAVAPWTRGYAPTSVAPDGWYQTGVRARDTCQLHEALGADSDAVLIGHDWGAGTAYVAATKEPDRWRRVVAMAVPPAGRVMNAFFDYSQLRRSSYMFIFQHRLAEALVPHDDWAFIKGLWSDWSPGYDHSEDVAHFVDSVRPDGHLAAALGYYRATFQPELTSPDLSDWENPGSDVPPQPTLYIHGQNDGCIGLEVADGVEADLSSGSKFVVVENAGHFAHLERPDFVNSEIVEFLGS